MKKKKRKRRSVKDPVLYDDDGELVQENRISGICQFPKETEMFKRLKRAGKRTKVVEQSGSSDDEGLLFDDIFGEEKASFYGQNYEMNDFIVSEEKSYGEGSSLRWLKMNKKKMEQVVTICLSALDDKVPITDDANQTLNHLKQVQASKVNLDNSSEFEPFFLANKYTTERDDLIRQTDTPERMQAYFVAFNPLRTEERSVEVSVLLNKIKKEDIMRFLELHHVEKFDVPFIAMYRKEQCLSLLDDFEQNEAENEDNDDVGQAGQLKWHKNSLQNIALELDASARNKADENAMKLAEDLKRLNEELHTRIVYLAWLKGDFECCQILIDKWEWETNKEQFMELAEDMKKQNEEFDNRIVEMERLKGIFECWLLEIDETKGGLSIAEDKVEIQRQRIMEADENALKLAFNFKRYHIFPCRSSIGLIADMQTEELHNRVVEVERLKGIAEQELETTKERVSIAEDELEIQRQRTMEANENAMKLAQDLKAE
ncbi:hypothetical protein ES288_A10G128700v1 [Gossypium darwinii]|uniref:S1 motif domain-containing protein n=1 Tax=Gossypium darwinii TaxID=34276 RepID=A0A5D2EY46_GOSDA|nr:hypothetical protein ES288_A10G128700v1 [Gossypium darwinii]